MALLRFGVVSCIILCSVLDASPNPTTRTGELSSATSRAPPGSGRVNRLQDDEPSGNLLRPQNIQLQNIRLSAFVKAPLKITDTAVQTTTTETDDENLPIQRGTFDLHKTCGRTPLLWQKIVGGDSAGVGEFPWQASLRRAEGDGMSIHKCGATLIHPYWIITAAHCALRIQRRKMIIRLGYSNNETVDNIFKSVDLKVARIRRHPQFDPITFENDLALLNLAEPAPITPHILPICLAPSGDYERTNVTISGYGAVKPGGGANSRLEKITVPLIGRSECERMYREAGNHQSIESMFMCAGFPQGGKDTCQGDSGGPVIQQLRGRWALLGVISWGLGCAKPGQPGVNTFLPFYHSWIAEVTGSNVTVPNFL